MSSIHAYFQPHDGSCGEPRGGRTSINNNSNRDDINYNSDSAHDTDDSDSNSSSSSSSSPSRRRYRRARRVVNYRELTETQVNEVDQCTHNIDSTQESLRTLFQNQKNRLEEEVPPLLSSSEDDETEESSADCSTDSESCYTSSDDEFWSEISEDDTESEGDIESEENDETSDDTVEREQDGSERGEQEARERDEEEVEADSLKGVTRSLIFAHPMCSYNMNGISEGNARAKDMNANVVALSKQFDIIMLQETHLRRNH